MSVMSRVAGWFSVRVDDPKAFAAAVAEAKKQRALDALERLSYYHPEENLNASAVDRSSGPTTRP